MNRVKRTAQKYQERKPEIDRVRSFRSHSRNARRMASRLKATSLAIENIKANLASMTSAELHQLCKDFQVKGHWRMNKAKMVNAIKDRL